MNEVVKKATLKGAAILKIVSGSAKAIVGVIVPILSGWLAQKFGPEWNITPEQILAIQGAAAGVAVWAVSNHLGIKQPKDTFTSGGDAA